MSIVGGKFETGEYFVADLIYAGDIMGDAVANSLQFLPEDARVQALTGLVMSMFLL
jgi:methanogenic corrinoid protein MtbC1